MDNQQETSWFCGILEGEGCFGKNAKSDCRVRIANCDTDIIEGCQRFLNNRCILHNTSSWKRNNRKREYEICIQGYNNCYSLYKHISFALDCRRQEFETMLGSSETTRDDSLSLYWLIGIYEAEASFSLCQKMSCYQMSIDFVNTRFNISEKVALILKDQGLSWYCCNRYPNNPKHKPTKHINIVGLKRCYRFLLKTENLWVSFKTLKICQLMLEFAESRIKKETKAEYSKREIEIYHQIQILNA
jgi:hypothetical protein